MEGSAAAGYGCQSFAPPTGQTGPPCAPPEPGQVLAGAETSVAGLIDQPVTWAADLVRVTGPVTVSETGSLTIAAGVRVEFAGFFPLRVHGRLWAVGQPDRRILFTAAEGLAGGWDGLEFLNVPAALDSSRLEHCVIEKAVARPAAAPDTGRIVGGTLRPETGGAVAVVGVNKLAIVSCVLRDNHAGYGGAVYCGHGASPLLAGNLITGNTAAWRGSALLNVYAFPKLVNNTIVANRCLSDSEFYLAGAVDNFNGRIILHNNIIRDNPTSHYDQQQVVETKDFDTRDNNIQNYTGHPTNQDLDPLFFGTGAHPYQLAAGSPCRDRGRPGDWTWVLGPLDLAGQPRRSGSALDMGAYEYSGFISGAPEAPAALPVLTAAPNPFNPRTVLTFSLAAGAEISLAVYDLRGRRVRNLARGFQPGGQHTVRWNGDDDQGHRLGSGLYFCRLVTATGQSILPVTLVK